MKTSDLSLKSQAIVLKNRLFVLRERMSEELDVFKNLRNKGTITLSEAYQQQEAIHARYRPLEDSISEQYFKTMRAYYQSKEYSNECPFHREDYKVSVKKVNELLKKLRHVPESKTVEIKDFPKTGDSISSSPKYFREELSKLRSAYQKPPSRYSIEDVHLLERDLWMSGLNGVERMEILVN